MADAEHRGVVAYLTDVEGMWERLASFARDNPVVRLDERERLHVAPGAVFVFGGDALDRGPHSRRVVRALLEAKTRQPGQVVMLAGNRDLNKLRLVRELAGRPLKKAPDEVRAGPRPALARWIFEFTMGARGALEFRRDELVREGLAEASDDDAVQSYLDDLRPDGELARYLAACQLAYVHGATLYVHGGVGDETLGSVPGEAAREGDVRRWAERLNGWYDQQMGRYLAFEPQRDEEPPYTPLIQYQGPLPGQRINPGSVIYNRHGDELNNPCLPPPSVREALLAQGIHRLVVGHTPSGDVPSVLRGEGFEFIIADNSRGRVATGSRLFVRDESVRVEARAKLDDESEVSLAYELPRGEDVAPLGSRVGGAEGPLVSGRASDAEKFLLFRYGPAYVLQQSLADAEALRKAHS